MRLKREAKVLKSKAIASFIGATAAFNSPYDQGRSTQVLLLLQHSFEMLLKAALTQLGERIFDSQGGRSKTFRSCVNLAQTTSGIALSAEDAGTLRAIDALRDDEQHWFNEVSEQLLYLHARAAVTLFDEILQKVFSERLVDNMPARVLPLSVDAPKEFELLVDDEFRQIKELLAPGRRARHQARARIRTLLAVEGHVAEDARVSVTDVDRIEKAIKAGEPRNNVFPRLNQISTNIDGEGITVRVHFTKKDGLPVRYESDVDIPAAAVREIDLLARYPNSPSKLAERLKISGPKSHALRKHLDIDSNPRLQHTFKFGSQTHKRFSDHAYSQMREVIREGHLEAIWDAHKPPGRSGRRDVVCQVAGCKAQGVVVDGAID